MLADLRRPENRRPLEDMALLLGISDVYERQRKNTNPKDPKYEAVTIHEAMKRWKPNMKDLAGHLKPSKDLCNHFSLEIARGKLLSPPVFPYVAPDLAKKPWAIQSPAQTSALDSWRKLQKSHKRPGAKDLSINQWFLYNLRYVPAGDLAGAWPPFWGPRSPTQSYWHCLRPSCHRARGSSPFLRPAGGKPRQTNGRNRPVAEQGGRSTSRP